MKKIIWFLIILFIAIYILVKPAHAAQEAGHSAILSNAPTGRLSQLKEDHLEVKRRVIREMLEKYNSPMIDSVDTFVKVCTDYDLNCYLLPSIAAVESGFGRQVKKGSYNPFGWDGGEHMFASWDEAIETVGKAIRENYIDRGASSLEGVGKIYAASPTWSAKVRGMMMQLQHNEDEYRLKSVPDDVEL